MTPDAPVLLRRQLHPDADLSGLPRFADTCWDLSTALPDRHTTGPRLGDALAAYRGKSSILSGIAGTEPVR